MAYLLTGWKSVIPLQVQFSTSINTILSFLVKGEPVQSVKKCSPPQFPAPPWNCREKVPTRDEDQLPPCPCTVLLHKSRRCVWEELRVTRACVRRKKREQSQETWRLPCRAWRPKDGLCHQHRSGKLTSHLLQPLESHPPARNDRCFLSRALLSLERFIFTFLSAKSTQSASFDRAMENRNQHTTTSYTSDINCVSYSS